MARKNALTFDEAYEMFHATSEPEKQREILNRLTVKQLKDFPYHKVATRKAEIIEEIIWEYARNIYADICECGTDLVKICKIIETRHISVSRFKEIMSSLVPDEFKFKGNTYNEVLLEFIAQNGKDESTAEPEQPELNETSEVQAKDYEAENRTVEKVLALYVPPKESVKNCHRLSKALIAEQRLEKWKVKHAVFWARGMPDKTKRKIFKQLEEF